MRSRPDSADGFLSPSHSSSRNGEKDWENASTTSSVTSNTEYTGRMAKPTVPTVVRRNMMLMRMEEIEMLHMIYHRLNV